MSLNPQQQHVLEHYCGGEFKHVENWTQVAECGDGLFAFLLREAQDAEDFDDFFKMLDTAIEQLRSVQGEIPL